MHHLSYRMHCLVRVDKGHAYSVVHCNPACTPYTITVNTDYTTHNTAETENPVRAHEKASTAAMLAAETDRERTAQVYHRRRKVDNTVSETSAPHLWTQSTSYNEIG